MWREDAVSIAAAAGGEAAGPGGRLGLRGEVSSCLLTGNNGNPRRSELIPEGSAGACLPGFGYAALGVNPRRSRSCAPHRVSCLPGSARFGPGRKTPALARVLWFAPSCSAQAGCLSP